MSHNNESSIYRNPNAPIEERTQDLLKKMTLKEKVRQLDQYFGTSFMSKTHPHMVTVMADDAEIVWSKVEELIGEEGIGCIHDLYGTADVNNAIQRYAVEKTRLGIPILFSEEALHGLLRPGFTVFPHAISMASTWNPDLVRQVGAGIAAETRSSGIHESFGPVLDIARDPRWGRVEETFGEDTYLTGRMGVAIVQGMQGDDLTSHDSIIAEPKHFAVHGIPESGLNQSHATVGLNDVHAYHLPVFEEVFREAGAVNAMCAYNSIDGVPVASDATLLTDLLRGEWDMPGFVRSDLGAIARLQHAHNTAGSDREAIRQAIEAGVDMQYYDYPNEHFQTLLAEMAESGEIAVGTIDAAVARVLKVKFMLGLFENPYVDPELSKKVVRSEKHAQVALQTARESLVLLKNDGDLLPLKKDLSAVAVIGPSADHARLGDYTPFIEGFEPVTLLAGVKKIVSPATQVLFAKGTGILADELTAIPTECLFDEAGQPGLTAHYFNNPSLEGEPVLVRRDSGIRFNWVITKPDERIESFNFSVRWTGKLVPTADFDGYIGTVSQDSMRLWLDGELLVDGWGKEQSARQRKPIRLNAGQEYALRVEYWKDTNGVDVVLGWSSDSEDIRNAVEIASRADVAIVALGDSERTCGEGVDRSTLDLPSNQLELLQAIRATGTPVVLVLQNGRPITLGWESRNVPAIVEAWYAGENGGDAIAETLFGDNNPAGRLPVSFPAALGQIPVHYNRRRGGQKQYMDNDNRPLYAFGHGLSYTRFDYSDLTLGSSSIVPGETTEASFQVTNAGDRDGDEVVQLYVRDVVSSMALPDKQLRHFRRIHLKAGETSTVKFTLADKDLRLLNRRLEWVVEPGEFRIIVGPSSDREALSASLTVR